MTATVTDEDVVITFWGNQDGRTVECQRGEWKGRRQVRHDNRGRSGACDGREQGDAKRSGWLQHRLIRYLAKAADGTVLHDINFHSIYLGPKRDHHRRPGHAGAGREPTSGSVTVSRGHVAP